MPVARRFNVNTEKSFHRAVTALPKVLKERLDADEPLNWTALESPETGVLLGEAVRAHRRLPEAVETLVTRLIGDVGIAASDLAASAERVVAAGRLESDSHRRGGRRELPRLGRLEGRASRRGSPEAVAGYATLALELAATVHETANQWTKAGERHQATAGTEASLLALCAVRISEHLQSHFEEVRERRTTAGVANALERAWNGQSLKTRTALSAIRLRVGRSVRAPLRRYYAPATGYRLHAFDLNEIRWLRALAEHAAIAVADEEQEGSLPEIAAKKPADTGMTTARSPKRESMMRPPGTSMRSRRAFGLRTRTPAPSNSPAPRRSIGIAK